MVDPEVVPGIWLSWLLVALILGAGTLATRRWWSTRPVLAPAYGLLSLGLLCQLAWVLTWASRTAAQLFSAFVVVAALAVILHAALAGRLARPVARPVAVVTLLSIGALLVCTGFAFLWGGSERTFATASGRYFFLPNDQVLPYTFGHLLWMDTSTVAMGGSDWNGSDRPPLQAGLILLLRPLWRLAGVPDDGLIYENGGHAWAFGASLAAQLLWVPALYCLVRTLRRSPAVAALVVGFVALTPVVMVNGLFTWPKLMAASFCLAAAAVMIEHLRRPDRDTSRAVVAAVVIFLLALLAHGGSIFFAPLLLGLGIWLLRRAPELRWWQVAPPTLAAVLGVWSPWWAYTTFADPSTGRLLKWHLAGVIDPTSDKALPAIVEAYSSLSLADWFETRAANLWAAFGLTWSPSGVSGWSDVLRLDSFLLNSHAIGLATPVLVGGLIAAAVSRLRGRPVPPEDGLALVLLGLVVVAILLWTVVMFIPRSTVVSLGAMAWVLLLAAMPLAHLAAWHRGAAALLCLAQALWVSALYWSSPDDLLTAFSPGWFAAFVVGLVVLALAAGLAPSTVNEQHDDDATSSGVPGKA